VNVNVQLVRVGAAAPYFYEGRRGRYATLLERLALRARAKKLGLWGRCTHTPYDPNKGVSMPMSWARVGSVQGRGRGSVSIWARSILG
jgi:endonuclease YncB( thermonuclease family)